MPKESDKKSIEQMSEELRDKVAALGEGEAFNRAVFNSLTAHLTVLDKAGTIIAVNEAWMRFARENGCDKIKTVGPGVNYLDACRAATGEFAEEAQEALAGLQAVLDGTINGFSLENPCHSKTEQRWFLMNVSALATDRGGAVVSHTDITKHKLAGIALRENQRRLSGIIASAMDAIITVDANQRITVFNAAAAQMFGCSVEEAIGESLDRFIPARFRSAHRRHIADFDRANATRRSMGSLGTVFGLRANGEEFPIEASISQIEANGRKYFTVILRDISQRIQSIEELRLERGKAQRYLDVVEVMLVVLDAGARIREINRKGCEVLEYEERELIDRNWFDICIPDQDREYVQSVFQRIMRGEAIKDEYIENKVLTKSGKQRLIRWRNTALRDEEGNLTGTLSSGEDITEMKKLEAQFLRTQRLESIGTLASGIAHDLNNILSPIMMGIQLLQMKQNDESARNLLDMILQNTQRGADLVKQVLSFARGTGGQTTIVQPNHLVKEVIKILHETLPKSISIKQSLATGLSAIEGDPTQLYQVLMNLCVNARDAMPDGGTLTIATENTLFDDRGSRTFPRAKAGPYVMITVSDTGAGISHELVSRIFDPFFTTKEPGSGTGLGLSTAQGILKHHGGFINVYSEPGKGAQFILYIPAIESAQTAQAVKAMSNLPAGRGETIMVVDDEAHIREITRTTLEAFGYNVLTAGEGAEGVSVYIAHQKEIAAVLTDMMMPLMDGPAMARALRRINPQVKIIASSGLADVARAADVSASGIEVFLPKPYTAESLLVTLDSLLHAGTLKG